jgi:hypothetical protein
MSSKRKDYKVDDRAKKAPGKSSHKSEGDRSYAGEGVKLVYVFVR